MKVYIVTEKDFEALRRKLEDVRLREGGEKIPCIGKPVDDLQRTFNFEVCRWWDRIANREALTQ